MVSETFQPPENDHHDIITTTPTKPKSSKQVPSRYLSPSPSVSRHNILLPPSSRSLSVSFQGQTFSLPFSKTKNTLIGDHVENTRPMDHHLWPGRIRETNDTLLSKNVTLELKLGQCVNLVSTDGGNSSLDYLNRIRDDPDGNSVKDLNSDTDSVSSGSTSGGIQENRLTRIRRRGIMVSHKFWQETNSRMRRLQGSSSLLSTNRGPKPNATQKKLKSKRFLSDNNHLSSNRNRALSPNKYMMASLPSRGMVSPCRNSVCGINNNIGERPSVLSFAVDVRRGNVGDNRLLDAHVMRLLYNRQLQWRFVNAGNEDMVLKQKHSVEENLWNAWIEISDLRDSVTRKRRRLQLLRQKLKLASILKAQMVFLEDWAYLDKNHSISLLGAIEAFKASTLRLPVTAGATADLQSMKDAVNSAVDVMQAMGSSMNSLCLQVEEVNLMVIKIAKMSAKERALLRICKDFLSVLSALKVQDCSLRTHMLQTSCVN